MEEQEYYFEMTISIGLVGCEQKVVIGPIPESGLNDDNTYPDKEYWIDWMWEHVGVSFEEIEEEEAKRKM